VDGSANCERLTSRPATEKARCGKQKSTQRCPNFTIAKQTGAAPRYAGEGDNVTSSSKTQRVHEKSRIERKRTFYTAGEAF